MTHQKNAPAISFRGRGDWTAVLATAFFAVLATISFVTAYQYPPIIDVIAFLDHRPEHALQTFYERYFTHNPRVGELALIFAASSATVRALMCVLGLSALIVGAFLVTEARLPHPGRSYDALWVTTFLAIIIILQPSPGGTFFYLAHNANYVLSFGVLLLFLGLYRVGATNKWKSSVLAAAFFALGVLAGMTNENTPLPFIGLLSLHVIWQASQSRAPLRIWQFAAVAGLAMGIYLLLSAPGQTSRYDGAGSGFLAVPMHVLFERGAEIWERYSSSWVAIGCHVLVGAAVVFAIRKKDNEITERAVVAAGMIAAAIGMSAALIFAPILPPRIMFASNAAVAIAGASALSAFSLRSSIPLLVVGSTASVVVVGFMVLAYLDTRTYSTQYAMRTALVHLHRTDGCQHITLPAYSTVPTHTILEDGASPDPNQWLNRARARVWGVKSVTIVPDSSSPVANYPCRDVR